MIPLLVGFSGGQIQLIDPARKELSRFGNFGKRYEKIIAFQSQVIQ